MTLSAFALSAELTLASPICRVLIFCNTRKACSQAAEVLAKKYRQELETRPQSAPWPKPARLDLKWADKKLAALLDVGIAYHHAGLEQQDRKVVENLFASSAISVVCESCRRSAPPSETQLISPHSQAPLRH